MTGDGRLGWLSPMCACVCKCVFPGNAGDHGARVLSLASPAFILVWLARPCHQSTSKPLGLGVCDFRGQSRKELEMSECQLSMILRIWSRKTFLLFFAPTETITAYLSNLKKSM